MNALAYEKITVSTSAVKLGSQLTSGVPVGAQVAIIQVSTADVRYRDDGTAPTSSDGFPLTSGTVMEYDANEGLKPGAGNSDLQFIRSGGSDATLHIAYYGNG